MKTITGVQNDLLAHYPIFIPKKKEEEQPPERNGKLAPIRKANSM